MKATPNAISEVLLLEPNAFGDERDFFMDGFNPKAFDKAVGNHAEFVQGDHSLSAKGVPRWLHYQLPPHAQGKLARATSGRAFVYKRTSYYARAAEVSLRWNDAHAGIARPLDGITPTLTPKDAAAPDRSACARFE